MEKQVLILTTGGTIEKSYSEDDGSIQNRESLLKEKLLQKLRLPQTNITIKEIMRKDSLNMDDNDREAIYGCIIDGFIQSLPIVVLHGTDTLEETVKLCYSKTPNPPVPVVFTGAMKPAGFDDSDALQNFTEALICSQILAPGFYVSFHGQVIVAPNVRKNHKLRTFESY